MQKIMTRIEAVNAGEPKYYTGRPCRNGHETFRYTSTGNCSACAKDRVHNFSVRARSIAANKLRGLVLVECYVYEEDVETLRTQALMLRTNHELSKMKVD